MQDPAQQNQTSSAGYLGIRLKGHDMTCGRHGATGSQTQGPVAGRVVPTRLTQGRRYSDMTSLVVI